MKKLLGVILLAGAALGACNKGEESNWDKYREWRELNNNWVAELQTRTNPDGTPYYKVIVPDWNPGSFILIHYFNDRKETEGNLSPLYTSTTDTRYKLHIHGDVPVDSSDLITKYGPGIYRSQVNANVKGWAVAMMDMRCGDTAEVVVPYGVGYGAQERGSMPPYTTLRFNVRLVDIPFYEASPY